MVHDTKTGPLWPNPDQPMRVVIVGAGPAGLVLAHYLLHKGNGRFRVSIFDGAEDPRETARRPPTNRRYSIGIAAKGRIALQGVPGLWEAVKARAIEIDHRSIYLFGHLFDLLRPNQKARAIMNDRAMMCAAMLTLLLDRYGSSGLLDVHFAHRCTGVDLERRRARFAGSPDFRCHWSGQNGKANGNGSGVSEGNGKENGMGVKKHWTGQDGTANGNGSGVLEGNGKGDEETKGNGVLNGARNGVRKDQSGSDPSARAEAIYSDPARVEPIHIEEEYDLLVGADGARSVVRNAVMRHLPSFDYEQEDLGTEWVVANIPVPPKVRHDVVIVIGYRKKGLHGIMLPSPIPDPEHSSMSFILKWPTGTFPAEWHAQTTPRDAKRFLEETFPWLEVPEDAAARLKAQRPARGFELKCSQYHDPRGRAVLIGDAAHCSGPNLGQGCNIGMQDAAALAQLLVDMEEPGQLPGVLERYSALRVPEGHALVDLSESQNAASDFLYAMSSVRTIVQSTLHKWVPWLVNNSIFGLGVSPMPLTSIYQLHKAWVDRIVESNRKHRLSRTLEGTFVKA